MIIEKKKNAIKEKNEDFLKLKEKHEIDLKDLQESYKELKEKREKLEEEYLKVEGEIKQQEVIINLLFLIIVFNIILV